MIKVEVCGHPFEEVDPLYTITALLIKRLGGEVYIDDSEWTTVKGMVIMHDPNNKKRIIIKAE